MPQFIRKKSVRIFTIVTFVIFALGGSFFLLNATKILGDSYYHVAQYLDESSPEGSVRAIRFYNKAIASYRDGNHINEEILASIQLGLLHYRFGNVLQVERQVLNALSLGDDRIPFPLKVKTYLLLAATSTPEKAERYVNKALEIANILDLKPQMIEAYQLLGKKHEYKAEFEKAELAYLNAIEIVENHPSIVYYVDMVNVYESLGELYAGDGKTIKAINYYDTALAHSFRQNPNSVKTAHLMKMLGDLYQERKEMAKACEFWRKSNEQYHFISHSEPVSVGYLVVPDSCNQYIS